MLQFLILEKVIEFFLLNNTFMLQNLIIMFQKQWVIAWIILESN